MNTPSNVMHESSLESVGNAPVAIPAGRRLYWSIRRELWESRSIYLAPSAVAAVILAGFLIGALHLREKMFAASALNPVQQHNLIEQPYSVAALLIMATASIVGVFYCLDALHSERRDRSILFWKSLPVSDFMTVLSKASIPLLVLPLLTFAIALVTQCLMLLLSTAVLLGSGQSIAIVWNGLPLVQMWLLLLYHLVAIHALWYAPIYAWLLLVSGWARRATFLWAVLPPFAIAIVEKIAFNTSHFAAMLRYRLSGGPAGATFRAGSMSMDPLSQLNPGRFLMSPGLWVGLAIAAAFLMAAVRLRRYRGPI